MGTESSYLALNEFQPAAGGGTGDTGDGAAVIFGAEPLNHLGFVVDDAEAMSERLLAAGYRESFFAPPHRYRIRKYFLDADGNEWEFVEYLTDDPALQNEYS